MKNPFKGLGGKVKSGLDKMKGAPAHKGETPKAIVDGVGDSSIIGGLSMFAAAAFLPAATGTVLLAGSLFLAAGVGAKYIASRMKVEAELPAPPAPKAPPAPEDAPASQVKPATPDFTLAVTPKQETGTTPAATPAVKPPAAPSV